jgi:hypothetical protein
MLTQLDDGGQEFVVAYASPSNNKTKAKYNSYGGSALQLFGLFHHFDYRSPTFEIPYGIKLTHMKVG